MESLRRLTNTLLDANARLSLGRRGSFSNLLSPATATAAAAAQRAASGLELTFITDRLIVTGVPVFAPTDKKRNQNNADELAAFLDTHHAGQYLVFNLSALGSGNDDAPREDGDDIDEADGSLGDDDAKQDQTEIAARFKQQMLEFAWDRDGMKAHTPPFDLIFRICYALFAWLALEPTHVALVHCESGKTRTGVVVACYLLYTRMADDPGEAFAEFYRQRWDMKSLTPAALRKKTPPSIQRFLAGFHDLIENQCMPNPNPLLLKAIIFRALPVDLQPCVQIWDDYSMIFNTEEAQAQGGDSGNELVVDWNGEDGSLAILWESGLDLDGGFSILCSFGNQYDDDDDCDASSKVLFRYTDSTWFLAPGLITLSKSKLDMMKQYEHGFDEEQFNVDLVFHESSRAPRSRVAIDCTGNNAIRQGIGEVTRHHLVLPDPAMHSNFIRMGFEDTAATLALQRTQNSPNAALDLLHSPGIAACFPQIEVPPSSLQSPSKSRWLEEVSSPGPLDSPSEQRQSTAEIAALQSQRSRYSSPLTNCASLCCICQDDDYMMRPQIVRCTGGCGQFYHTTCVGLKRIPFGLTTLSDRTNHAVYVKKYFNAWQCDQCSPPLPDQLGVAMPAPMPAFARAFRREPVADPTVVVPKSPESMKMDKLKEFLAISGVSVDDLLRAATTANVTISHGPDSSGSTSEKTESDQSPVTATMCVEVPYAHSTGVTKKDTRDDERPPSSDASENMSKSDTEQVPNADTEARRPKQKCQTSATSDVAPPEPPKACASNVHAECTILAENGDVYRPDVPAATAVGMSVIIPSSQQSNLPAKGLDEAKSKRDADETPAPTAEKAIPPENARSAMLAAIAARKRPDTATPAIVSATNAVASSTDGAVHHAQASSVANTPAIAGSSSENPRSALFAAIAARKPKDESTTGNGDPRSALMSAIAARKRTQPTESESPGRSDPRSALMSAIAARKTPNPEKLETTRREPEPSTTDPRSALLSAIAARKPAKEEKPSNIGTSTGSDPRAAMLSAIMARKQQAPSDQDSGAKSEGSVDDKKGGMDARAALLSALMAKRQPQPDDTMPHGATSDSIKSADQSPQSTAPSSQTSNSDAGGTPAEEAPSICSDDMLLKDHEIYGKYFKMLKMGFPEPVVRHKILSDSGDVRVLELGPDATLAQLAALARPDEKSSKPNDKPAVKKRRKKLHWQAIPDERLSLLDQETIWEEKDDDMMEFEMDMDELESLFFASDAPTSEKRRATNQSKPLKRKQTVSLIDGKRAMNAAISLARIKLSYAEIANAIISFDACGLSLQQLTGIREYLPTQEEVTAVRKYTGDVSVLGEAEKFMLEMCKVPRCAARTECLVFKLAFPARSDELKTSLTHLVGACEQVKTSRLLKILLSMVLKLGNTLNGSDAEAGGIRGFTVDSLLRLGNTKAWNQKTTVLHYLVRLVKKNQSPVLEFSQELTNVPLAARESLEMIDEDLTKLQDGLMHLSEEYQEMQKESEANGDESNTTIQAMHDAVEDIGRELEQLDQLNKQAREEIVNIFDYFGEDRAKNPVEFFSTLASFCVAFQAARKEVDAADDAAQRAERVRMRRTVSMSQAGSVQADSRKHRALSDRFSTNSVIGETKSAGI